MLRDSAPKYSLLGNEDPSNDEYSDEEGAVGFSARGTTPNPRQLLAELRGSRNVRLKPMGCFCKTCMWFGVLVGFGLCVMIIVLMSSPWLYELHTSENGERIKTETISDKIMPSSPQSEPIRWQASIPNAGTESPVRAVHVNNDGVLDFLVGVSLSVAVEANDYCQLLADDPEKPYCAGGIYAFSGADGAELWFLPTHDEIFELVCPHDLDLNLDGQPDCFGSGRHGSMVAFNPRNGSAIWRETLPDIERRWSVFGPAFSEDLTGDSIPEILVVNGGDTAYTPLQHDRDVNYILLLDGRSGRSVGQRFPMPDNRESYMPPVLYRTERNGDFVLFGTGGETVPGGLYMMSVLDLYKFVTSNQTSRELSSSQWPGIPRDSHGVITLRRPSADQKGVMLPPALIDLNGDSQADIVSLSFDGYLTVYNGANLLPLWNPINFAINESSTETYSEPSFAHFNNDSVLDIMVSWWTGSWPSYTSMSVFVIDGSDGTLLWYIQTPSPVYAGSSHLTLSLEPPTSQPTASHRDAFIFELSSTNEGFMTSDSKGEIGISKREADPKDRRHIGHGDSGIDSCADMDRLFVDHLILDSGSPSSAYLISRVKPEKYFFNLSDAMMDCGKLDATINGHTVGRRRRHSNDEHDHEDEHFPSNRTRCAVLKPRDASTGILVDMDRDGKLDYVSAHTKFAIITDDEGNPVDTYLSMSIEAFPLEHMIPNLEKVALNNVGTLMKSQSVHPKLQDMKISKEQEWPQLYGPNLNLNRAN